MSIIKDGLQAQNQQNNGSFTYDKGEGTKDAILMTGPLGEIYTKTLNTYFSKKDLTQSEEPTGEQDAQALANNVENKLDGTEQKDTMAMESQILDVAMLSQIVGDLDQAVVDKDLGSTLTFHSGENTNMDPEEITTTAFIMDMQQALRPEVIDQIQTAKANNKYHTVLVVHVKPFGTTAGMIVDQATMTINEGDRSVVLANQTQDFSIAAEELYVKQGVQVYMGMGHFLNEYKKTNF